MSNPDEIDHKHTRDLICPWCGQKQTEPHEYFGIDSECADIECGTCLEPFSAVRHIQITYSTEKE